VSPRFSPRFWLYLIDFWSVVAALFAALYSAKSVHDGIVHGEKATAELDRGRIVLRAPFSYLLVCKRIPGACWDRSRKAWLYPATRWHAGLVCSIPGIEATERLRALAAPAARRSAESQPGSEPPIELPAGLKTKPWRHQVAAYRFAMERFSQGFQGVLLGIIMGGGKSLSALMLLLGLRAQRVLIVCPLRVIRVWRDQLERHLSTPLVVVALDEEAGSVRDKQQLAKDKLELAEATSRPFVSIVNYDSVWREPFGSWAMGQSWDLVVLDELHRIKRPGGKASLYFKRLRNRARYRLGLTGTPMPHSPLDLYAQFRFLDPSIFGPSYSAFRQKFARLGGFQSKQVIGFQHLDELEELMRRVTFRVGKDALDLPPETSVTYECSLSVETQRLYRRLERDLVAEVVEGRVTAANALVKLLRLQQLTGGWLKLDDGQSRRVDWSKQKLLEDTLEDIGPEEPVVVFCRFHADLDAVHEACASLGYTSLELSGRRVELDRWQAGEAQVLAVQAASGGVGVDLSNARFALYYSLSFSLGEYDQARSRVHRPGQTKPVEHIHLVVKDSIDGMILSALERRAEVIELILQRLREGAR
jgi:SNF2 family DNA or RNA helicase